MNGGDAIRALLFPGGFLIVMDKPALVYALPVFGQESAVRPLFHSCMILLPADKAFHQAGLLINQFCGMFLFCHIRLFGRAG